MRKISDRSFCSFDGCSKLFPAVSFKRKYGLKKDVVSAVTDVVGERIYTDVPQGAAFPGASLLFRCRSSAGAILLSERRHGGCRGEIRPAISRADEEGDLSKENVRFLIDNAALPVDCESHERIVLVFSDDDDDALAAARGAWADCKTRGFDLKYWQADERGRWQRKQSRRR